MLQPGEHAVPDERRRQLIKAHKSEFTAAELDAEVGLRQLVLVLGGGGGAGYVYTGAVRELRDAGMDPAYVFGGSMGAIIGGLLARTNPPAVEEALEFGRTVTYRSLLAAPPAERRHGIASAVYGWALEQGMCLISGPRQSPAAHALWHKLAQHHPLRYVHLQDKRLTHLGPHVSDAVLEDFHTRMVLWGVGWDEGRFVREASCGGNATTLEYIAPRYCDQSRVGRPIDRR